MRQAAIWVILTALTLPALYLAATSPLLQWREPIYIGAAFAGVLALALLLLQPLLAARLLPGVRLGAVLETCRRPAHLLFHRFDRRTDRSAPQGAYLHRRQGRLL